MREMNDELPSGWRKAKLADVCDLNPRRSQVSRRDDAMTSFLPMPAIGEGGVGIIRPELRPYRELRKGYTSFVEGDVLFAKITPCMQNAKHAIARNLTDGIGFGSTEFHVLRARSEMIPEWLHFFLLQPSLLADATRHFTGAVGQRRVPDEYLASLEIPLPPMEEQRRIAARLREQLSTLAEARAALEAQLAGAAALISAYVSEDTCDPAAKLFPTREVLVEVTEGVGENWRDQPVLGATRAGLATAKEGVGKQPQRYKSVTPGTIFYNPMRILLGSIALVDDGDAPGITSPDYVVMRGREGVLHPVWFYHWFRSPAGAGFIKSLTRGAVRERLLFNRLAPGQIIVPPWSRQLQTVDAIRAATALRGAIAAKLSELEKLPAALLRSAFSPNGD